MPCNVLTGVSSGTENAAKGAGVRASTAPAWILSAATVTAVVGYDRDNIPPAIKAAILLILGTLYDNESDNLVGRSVSELSLTAEKLLLPWRVTPYGDV